MIPRVIHFVWLNPPIPAWILRNAEEWRRLNPGYEIKWHGPESLLPEFRQSYDAAEKWCSKADLVVLSVILQEGGWLFDTDFWPFRSLDDVAHSWGLDGKKAFVALQDNPKDPVSNGVLAAEPGNDGVKELVAAALRTPWKKGDRCLYGPELFSAVVKQRPGLFTISSAPWFYPVYRHPKTGEPTLGHYRRALQGNIASIRRANPATGGQLPVAMHLWCDQIRPLLEATFANPGVESKGFVLMENIAETNPLSALADGIRALGLELRGYGTGQENVLDDGAEPPLCLIGWNNVRRSRLAAAAVRRGVPALWSEHGFFQRANHAQVDPEGFLHRASWHRQLAEPAPAEGAERLARFYPNGLTPVRPRSGGYILVLGQVAGDTQLADSEIQGPIPLQGAVKLALPEGAQAYFRPHPQCFGGAVNRQHLSKLLPQMPGTPDPRAHYTATKAGLGLAEALAGARFVVTINSNAAVEALAAGVPVLAFGPHLGIDAGAIKRTTQATLAADLREMLAGWAPEQSRVENFLRWLAARQWSREELATPEVARALLESAGVTV